MAEPIIGVTESLLVGEESVFQSDCDDDSRGVVFEDDGDTGYFYARDHTIPETLFVDALHIYNVDAITDKDIPSELSILWSFDWRFAALIINNYPHAVFDFELQTGYSRHNYPDPLENSGWSHAPWSDRLRLHFYS